MSFIDVDGLGDVKEQEAVPEGMYDVIVSKVLEKKDGDTLIGLSVIHEIEGDFDAPSVFHYLSFPIAGDDEKKVNNKKRFLKKYLDTFQIDVTKKGFDAALLEGATARVSLKLDEFNGKVTNKINL